MHRRICNMAVLAGSLLLALNAAAQNLPAPSRAFEDPLASRGAYLYRAGAAPRKEFVAKTDPARTWKDHMTDNLRRDDEGDGCLLSFALGGALDVRGYRGIRLFGATRTLSLPRKEAR